MRAQLPVVSRPTGPAEPAPLRRPLSARRTSTLDLCWPGEPGTELRAEGRARDVLTLAPDRFRVLAADRLRADMDPGTRTILRVDSLPEISELGQLAGARAGRGLRATLAALLPGHHESPVYQLLDDLAGGSLVAPFARQCLADCPELTGVPTSTTCCGPSLGYRSSSQRSPKPEALPINLQLLEYCG
jgi:hypothetical protein